MAGIEAVVAEELKATRHAASLPDPDVETRGTGTWPKVSGLASSRAGGRTLVSESVQVAGTYGSGHRGNRWNVRMGLRVKDDSFDSPAALGHDARSCFVGDSLKLRRAHERAARDLVPHDPDAAQR